MLLHRHSLVSASNFLTPFLVSNFPLFCFALLHGELQYFECVFDEVSLYLLISLCIRIEARRMINLKHPGLEISVEHHIEPQKLKAAVRLFLLARTVNMLELWLHRQYSFDNNRLYFFPDLVSMLARCRFARFRRRLRHQPTQAITDSQLMFLIIEVAIALV
jgi:hypothetical protein